jgi:hypothetical protein
MLDAWIIIAKFLSNNMNTINYQYKNRVVEFMLSGDLMVNATEMGAVFNVKPYEFTRREETQRTIEAMKKKAIGGKKGADFTPFLSQFKDLTSENVVKCVNGTPILITIPGREGSTWMHRWLAIDFAMYLDVDFKIWVLEKIDLLFVDFSLEKRKIETRKLEIRKELALLQEASINNPTANKIFRLNEELQDLTSYSFKLNKSFNKSLFDEE